MHLFLNLGPVRVSAHQGGRQRLRLDHVWHRHCTGPPHLPIIAFTAAQRPMCAWKCTWKRRVRDLSPLRAVGSSVRQFAMHERYPGLNLFNSRHTAQLDRRCPRITPPTRHLTRADLARRSATILASEPPPEVIIGRFLQFRRLCSPTIDHRVPLPRGCAPIPMQSLRSPKKLTNSNLGQKQLQFIGLSSAVVGAPPPC